MMQSPIIASPKLFIGMDIHKNSWSVHLRTDLFDHKGFNMPPQPQTLVDYVSSHFDSHEVSLTYEAGCCGFSAARHFLSMGWQVKVVNPSDIPRSDKQQYQKTDKLDCRNLCKQLQQDQLHGIYVPTEREEQLRSLLRQRNQVVKQLRTIKSHIKGLLLFHGIHLPDQFDNPNWSKDFIAWLRNIPWSHTTGAASMQSKLRILELLNKEYLQTSNAMR
jgi:transposase